MASTTTRKKQTKYTSDETVEQENITTAWATAIEDPTSAEPTDTGEAVVFEPIKAKTFKPTDYVTVKSGVQGELIYKNIHTGETFIWENFGDEQEMELRELKNAKSSSKQFFINNWFLFDDPAVIDYLGVGQYYKYALNTEQFNELFEKDPDEIAKIIPTLSQGQKKSLAVRAYQLVKDGTIDSMKTIKVLEEGLNVRLVAGAQ